VRLRCDFWSRRRVCWDRAQWCAAHLRAQLLLSPRSFATSKVFKTEAMMEQKLTAKAPGVFVWKASEPLC
jgi:hypothetical protein